MPRNHVSRDSINVVILVALTCTSSISCAAPTGLCTRATPVIRRRARGRTTPAEVRDTRPGGGPSGSSTPRRLKRCQKHSGASTSSSNGRAPRSRIWSNGRGAWPVNSRISRQLATRCSLLLVGPIGSDWQPRAANSQQPTTTRWHRSHASLRQEQVTSPGGYQHSLAWSKRECGQAGGCAAAAKSGSSDRAGVKLGGRMFMRRGWGSTPTFAALAIAVAAFAYGGRVTAQSPVASRRFQLPDPPAAVGSMLSLPWAGRSASGRRSSASTRARVYSRTSATGWAVVKPGDPEKSELDTPHLRPASKTT